MLAGRLACDKDQHHSQDTYKGSQQAMTMFPKDFSFHSGKKFAVTQRPIGACQTAGGIMDMAA